MQSGYCYNIPVRKGLEETCKRSQCLTCYGLAADVQQMFGVEAQGGHGGDHVQAVRQSEPLIHGQSFPLEEENTAF